MTDTKPIIAFFGATGGSTIACLAPALQAGYHCTALARNPPKLQDLLHERGISESLTTSNLSIVTGNVTDLDAVRETLSPNGHPVDLIITGIGGQMQFTNPLKPTLDNPTVCQEAVRTIFEASRPLQPKPILVALSTTGISEKKRDVPLLMVPMYHWMLKVPHEDKKVMERLILEEVARPVEDRGIRDYVIIRPSLLTDGSGSGIEKIREGTEEDPAVGNVISRNEVGAWMFEKIVRQFGSENPYLGKVVTITT